MNIVGIDTSFRGLDLAIFEGDKISLEITLSGRERTSKNIVEAFKTLLERGGISPSELDGIAVVKGPGSFTGLKLGMTMAKMISYVFHIPLVGIDLFEIIGFYYRYLNEGIEILIPSRKGEFYYARYLREGNISEKKVIREEVFSVELNKDLWIFAPSCEVEDVLRVHGFSMILPGWEFRSKAYIASLLGMKRLKEKKGGEDPFTISPLYIRHFPF